MSAATPSALAAQLAFQYRTPSFRDLQRTCSFLQAKSDACEERNEQLSEELCALQDRNQQEMSQNAVLEQSLELSTAGQRAAQARADDERMRAEAAEAEVVRLNERSGLVEAGLATAQRREAWLLDEVREARTSVAAARQDTSDLRAANAQLATELKRCESERDELLAQLGQKSAELSGTRDGLAAERRALNGARSEIDALRAECEDAAAALSTAREANEALVERSERSEREAAWLTQRAQQLGGEAQREAESRVKADRVAFSLREQNAALQEGHEALRGKLREGARLQRAAKDESVTSRAEAKALAIRLGLYRSVLKSDVAAIMGVS